MTDVGAHRREPKRVRELLQRLPENIGEVRKIPNELARVVRRNTLGSQLGMTLPVMLGIVAVNELDRLELRRSAGATDLFVRLAAAHAINALLESANSQT